uniref:NADH dehydrogenase [ubiquinone] iron-sulfur protein 6, mitochondrial n=1 Tax=Spermophilus dauricus TaxID=99837 RepID=A0A8C9UJI9_SPEDA
AAPSLTRSCTLVLPRAADTLVLACVLPSRCCLLGSSMVFFFQVYDDKDYRKIRFVGRQKEVNENFAIDLIAEQPVSEVDHRVISCDGGGGALGHPKVYINLIFLLNFFQDKETKTGTCGYCGLRFQQHRH